MATNYLSPNMSLVIPVPTQEPAPNWAFDLNASLTILDGHNHVPGSGVQIPTAGININADLTWNNAYNAIGLRSVRFFPQTIPLALSTDLGCIYESGVDLYYNDGNGNQIRITQGGAVAGASGTITGLPSGTASASYSSASGTFVFQQATSTAANLDVGTVIVRYPGSYPTPAGNYIAIEAPSSLASGYAITLPSLPTQTNVVTLGSTGILSSVTYDQVGENMTLVGADAIADTITSVGANTILANRTRGVYTSGTVPLGGIGITASSGSFSTNSSSIVTNLDILLVTGGKPIFVGITPDSTTSTSAIANNSPLGGNILFLRDSGVWMKYYMDNTVSFFAPTFWFIDNVVAGTHHYQIQATAGGGSTRVTGCSMTVYELD